MKSSNGSNIICNHKLIAEARRQDLLAHREWYISGMDRADAERDSDAPDIFLQKSHVSKES